jgi:hypothetical protein
MLFCQEATADSLELRAGRAYCLPRHTMRRDGAKEKAARSMKDSAAMRTNAG